MLIFCVDVRGDDDDDDGDDDDDDDGWSVYKQSNRLDMKPPDRTGVPDETTRCPLES